MFLLLFMFKPCNLILRCVASSQPLLLSIEQLQQHRQIKSKAIQDRLTLLHYRNGKGTANYFCRPASAEERALKVAMILAPMCWLTALINYPPPILIDPRF